MGMLLLVVLCLARLLRAASAIQITAPARCGGTRIVTHARALFGRQLEAAAAGVGAGAAPYRIYAPYPPNVTADDDIRALGDLCTAPPAAEARGRVAVAQRGGCDFVTKTWHAQQAGCAGLVVVNQKRVYQLVNMKLNDTLVDAGRLPPVTNSSPPTVMIRYYDWQRVAACRGAGGGGAVKVELVVDGVAVYDVDYGRDSLNYAMMRGMLLWILCQCGVNAVRYKRRFAALRSRAETIAKMESHPFGTHPSDCLLAGDEHVCAVCLHGFAQGQVVRRLRCPHTFHKECIDPWLQASSNSCPICKRSVGGLDPPPPNVSYGATT